VYYKLVDTTQDPMRDEEIAHKVQQGDRELFGVLVERYEEKLLRYGRKFLARQEDMEDIVQDVFLSAYQNIQSFDHTLSFSPWIYRIAHNAYVNALRKHERGPLLIDFDTLISHPAYEDPAENEREQRDMRADIERGLEFVRPKYREVLALHYFEDLAYKDIAEVLGVPVGTVGIRLKRAKEALKEALEKKQI
jgi:RNA polymerase sigma-70 factor (ECF subfamily)